MLFIDQWTTSPWNKVDLMLIIHSQFRTALVGIRYGIVPWFQSPVIFLLHILIALLYSKHRIGELALRGWGSYVLCRCMNIFEAHMSLTFNGSSVTHRLEHSDVTKIHEWVSFYMYFYMGQPHILSQKHTPCRNTCRKQLNKPILNSGTMYSLYLHKITMQLQY